MTTKRRILAVIGTRPEAIKLAPVVRALRGQTWADCRVLATAQHRQLLDQVLAFFGIAPDRDLDLMLPEQSLADLTARMIEALDPVLGEERPDLVLAQGDTTTVLVAALCSFQRRIPFAHVEAGLRTGDKWHPFPEEQNRVLVGRLADLHFAPTLRARDNLLREGVPAAAVHVVGNTVVDALLWTVPRVDAAAFAPPEDRRLVLVTAHRRESFGPPLDRICAAVAAIARRGDVQVLWPVHPNPAVRSRVERQLTGCANVELHAPLDYPQMVAAMQASTLILTDSGGVQEEAPSLGVPVLVLRDLTERPEGVEAGAARVVGVDGDRIVDAATRLLDEPAAWQAMANVRNPYGDGASAQRIVEVLRSAGGG